MIRRVKDVGQPFDSTELKRTLEQTRAELRDKGWRFPDEPAAATVRRWIAIVAIVETGYDDTVEEFTCDLGTRDYIEELCKRLPGYWADYFVSAVAPWDERFRAATVEDSWLLRVESERPWWHHRLPRIWPGRASLDDEETDRPTSATQA
jgi:hypothetical protein